MNRTRALDRRHRRILGAGIVVSLAVHAAVFATVRLHVLPIARASVAVLDLVPPDGVATVWKDAPVVVQTRPTESMLPLEFEPAGSPGEGAAPPPPRAAAAAGGLDAPVAADGMFAFQEMVVRDPLTNGRVQPIAFGDLPEAEFTVATAADADDYPIYVPGSIGTAKRNWAKGAGAGNGDRGDRAGSGIGFVGVGGGQCPMPMPVPGRGRTPPPVWKLASLRS